MDNKPIGMDIKLLIVLGLLGFFTFPIAASAMDQIVNGVITGVDQKQVPGNEKVSGLPTILPPPDGATVVNFDETTQPCGFAHTIALTTQYLGTKGVTFAGPADVNGGAVLNECGNFGVTGHSKPNFLAFNKISYLSDGGIPIGPETITFISTVSQVQINAGGANSGVVIMTAYDEQNVPIGSVLITGTAALQTLLIQKEGIKKVIIQFNGESLVLDDLAFLSETSPIVSISTDKAIYSPGDTMTVSIDINNPTTNSITADVDIHLLVAETGTNVLMNSARLTMAPGFDKKINTTILISNRGTARLNATWIIAMQDTASPPKLISEDKAEWQYKP